VITAAELEVKFIVEDGLAIYTICDAARWLMSAVQLAGCCKV
jgi:hypothetical protein